MKDTNPCCATPENHLVLHRSFRSVALHVLLAIIISVVVLWYSIENSMYGLTIQLTPAFAVTLPLFLLIALVLLIRPILLMLDSRHEITCHHVRSVVGRCSLQRHFIEISYEEILGVRANQSIIERVLGVGSIVVWTATAEHPDLVMKGIRDPEHYARLIGGKVDSRIVNNQKNSSSMGVNV